MDRYIDLTLNALCSWRCERVVDVYYFTSVAVGSCMKSLVGKRAFEFETCLPHHPSEYIIWCCCPRVMC